MKKFMIDSNVIIEYMKDNPVAVDVLNFVKDDKQNEYYITLDTIEEIIYIMIKHFSKKSYWDLKNDRELTKKIYSDILPLIQVLINSLFKIAHSTNNTNNTLFDICKDYGLLPKDALIFSICVDNGIDYLITFDKDFVNIKTDKVRIISGTNDIPLEQN